MNDKKLTAHHVLWAVYVALLTTLLPHTAWVFAQFESDAPGPFGWQWGKAIAWTAAFAFEAAIAVFTHKLAQHNEKTPRYTSGWIAGRKLAYRYLNPFALALAVALAYSALANFTHAVQFGRELQASTAYGLPAWLYSLTFGAILPLCSLIFALALSTANDTEAQRDDELDEAKRAKREANKQLAQIREELEQANAALAAANQTEQRTNGELTQIRQELEQANADRTQIRAALEEANARLTATEHEFAPLTAPQIKDRIKFAYHRWPDLPNSAIAIITESSPSYVSETINSNGASKE